MYRFLDFLEKLKNKKVIFSLLFVISLLVFFLIYQKKNMEQQMDLKIQFIEQKNTLRDELDDLIDEHDDLLDEYGDLNNQLFQFNTQLDNNIFNNEYR